ncbi:DNA methyltransferase [Burkholderia ambifaria]|uniref:DNA methyltransferase n=1 Tax=Burkholderia ambifaria TaxID=152480 RepID=UPI000F80C3DF|nr:DNA methyltransferase [Burkholderia ambifaria]
MTVVTSWLRLTDEAADTTLPADLRARDAFAARDCGWVEQMVPFIGSHATPGGWIVDPFGGFGTTLVAAARCGVPALGVEIDPARVAFARERLARTGAPAARYPVLAGDLSSDATQAAARRAGGPFTLCLTSVPYFGCAGLPDGPRDGQLYGVDCYAPYLERMRNVFAGVHALLEPGGWCIAMAQNLRVGGRFVPLAWDVARLLGERFVLHEERVLIYEHADGPAPHGAGATDRTHEYALVCRKAPLASDADAARALVAALTRDGFAFAVIGGFARRLAAAADDATADALLNDVDLVVPPDDADLSRLLQWLDADGFSIESWNARVTPPVAATALQYRHYFRARRLDARGRWLQVDVTVAATREAFDACLRANPAPGASG